MIPKARPVSVLVEQGGGNVGGMGWRPLSGGIAALWTQTICAIVSGDLETDISSRQGLLRPSSSGEESMLAGWG